MTIKEAVNHPNATLLDVREPYELDTEGEVPGAINIPMGDIPAQIEEIKTMKQPIVIFCRSGNRSATAVLCLQAQGVEEIYNGGGFQEVIDLLELA